MLYQTNYIPSSIPRSEILKYVSTKYMYLLQIIMRKWVTFKLEETCLNRSAFAVTYQ